MARDESPAGDRASSPIRAYAAKPGARGIFKDPTMSANALPTRTLPVSPQTPAPAIRRKPFRWPQLGYAYPVVFGLAAAGIGGFAWVYSIVADACGLTEARFRFDPTPLINAGWVIQAHVVGAATAFLLGIAILVQRKGSTLHRKLGWTWVVAMGLAALSSVFIRTSGSFSWIHAFSGLTLIALPMGVAAARMHIGKMHARFMTGIFLGGAFTAGLFTFLPGRLMWDVLFTAA